MQTGYAMIVGAGSSTGAAVAKRLAAEGWPVVLTRRTVAALDALAAKLEEAGARALKANPRRRFWTTTQTWNRPTSTLASPTRTA